MYYVIETILKINPILFVSFLFIVYEQLLRRRLIDILQYMYVVYNLMLTSILRLNK